MCKLFKIDGVEKVHSSLNDCILEWKLFEKIKGKQLFFIDQNLYHYNENYIIPVTCLNKHPELANYAGISIPYLTANATTIFEYSLPPKILKRVKKFPTNITGISIESGISAALNVEEKDNSNFLIENKKQLQYIGSLDCPIRQIPIIIRKDGSLKSLDCENNDYIDEINETTKIIIKSLSPVLNFIANEIFKTSKIFNQELSISPDGKVLAICDLSNEESVLEIKTFNVFSRDGEINKSLVRQLYYESKGRKTFVLSIIFDERVNNRGKVVLDDIKAIIYDIKIEETEPKPIEKIKILNNDEITVLRLITENPLITNVEISRLIDQSQIYTTQIVKELKSLKYIVREDESKKRSKWIILRNINDIKTIISVFNGIETLIFNENDKTTNL